MRTFEVEHTLFGRVTACADTGIVVNVERWDGAYCISMREDGDFLDRIQRFDLAEWRKHNGGEGLASRVIDILDISFVTRKPGGGFQYVGTDRGHDQGEVYECDFHGRRL